jgi:hypothetical protein
MWWVVARLLFSADRRIAAADPDALLGQDRAGNDIGPLNREIDFRVVCHTFTGNVVH